jgi:hypothetical protein
MEDQTVALLTTKKAAKILATELGWAVTAGDVEDAVASGRLRAETGPGRRSPYLIPEEEVLRVLEEDRRKKALETEEGRDSGAQEPVARVWDLIPKQGMDYLFGLHWKLRRHRWK